MKLLRRLAYLLTLVYVLAVALLYFFQEPLIFHPAVLPATYTFEGGSEEYFRTADGVDLHTVAYTKADPTGVILYLHGNTGSNKRIASQIRPLRDTEYDLYTLDYRGYGKSGGVVVSEEQLFADAQLVYDSLAVRYGEGNIILVGYSLGTGMASYLAAGNHPKYCLLVAPYASLTAMKNLWFWAVPDFILKYPLNNEAHLAAANCPVTVLHGDRDDLIPYTMAEQLKEAAPDRVELIPLPGTSHRGAIFHDLFRQTVFRITQ